MEFVFLIIGSLIIAIVVDIFEDIIVGYSIFFNKVCTTAEILCLNSVLAITVVMMLQ